MIVHKLWWERRHYRQTQRSVYQHQEVLREGWLLFGFLPLYVRDLQLGRDQ